jgi:hypothetical protein
MPSQEGCGKVGLSVQEYYQTKIDEVKSKEKKKLENYLRLV